MPQPSILKMRVFVFVWLGQVLSLLGSSLTNFALSIWVYQLTGQVTQLAFISLATTLPSIVISPLAGALVDRWKRRWVMILSDSGSAVSTGVLALLLVTNHLEVWHIYLATAVASSCSAFQIPAYSAATTLLVDKEYLGRASGMIQLGRAVALVISPLLAGSLLGIIQLRGIILIDFASFFFALVSLLLVRFPEPKNIASGKAGGNSLKSLLHEIADGWRYVTRRTGLLGLIIFLSISNFCVGAVEVLFSPLLLSFTTPAILGIVTSVSSVGAILGSLMVSIYGGTRRLMWSVLGFQFLCGLSILVAGMRASPPLIALAGFSFFLGWPILNVCTQVIFQKKVEPNMQGRVFALKQTFSDASFPLAYIISGVLADRIFEPLMATDGSLAGSIGEIIGTGPGRGIGLMFILMGAMLMLVTVVAYQYPRLRLMEDELPDAEDELPDSIDDKATAKAKT